MGFTVKVEQAAHRHHDAAKSLDSASKRAAAAYLFGLTAECAVKSTLEKLKVRPKEPRKTDPYYAHFPELRNLLSDALQGRMGKVLAPFTTNDFLRDWDIAIRYAPSDEIVGSGPSDKRYERWKTDANTAIKAMEET